MPIVALHELEVRNALRAQRGRGLITERQLSDALGAFAADVREHRLLRVRVDWPELSWLSLDVLHVAAARPIGCERLITGEGRQARLAGAVGLRVVNISASVP